MNPLTVPTIKHYRDKYSTNGEICVSKGIYQRKTLGASPKIAQTVKNLVFQCIDSDFVTRLVERRNMLVKNGFDTIHKLAGDAMFAHSIYLKDPLTHINALKSTKLKVTQTDKIIKATNLLGHDMINLTDHKIDGIVKILFGTANDAVKDGKTVDNLITVSENVKLTMDVKIRAKCTVTYWKKSFWTINVKFVIESLTIKSSQTANAVLGLPPCRPQTSASVASFRTKSKMIASVSNKGTKSTEIIDSVVAIMKEKYKEKEKITLAKNKSKFAKTQKEKEIERALGTF